MGKYGKQSASPGTVNEVFILSFEWRDLGVGEMASVG